MHGTHLAKFIRRHGCLTSDAKTASHLLMTGYQGGKLAVPDELHEEFLDAYGRDLLEGSRISLVERRTVECFRLHFDVDVGLDLCDEDLRRLAGCVVEAVSAYYEGACVVCASMRFSDRTQRAASSLHLIYPAVFVDDARAQWVRRAVVAKCASSLVDLPLDFEKVLDACIYGSNGFRMLGSDKAKRCQHCSKRGSALCSACGRHGFTYEDRVYLPWCVLPADDGAQALLLSNLAYAAKACSVRAQAQRLSDAKVPAPSCCEVSSSSSKRRRVDSASRADLAENVRQQLELDLRAFAQEYGDIELRAGTFKQLSQGSSTYLLKVHGPGSHYCMNKGGSHGSSTVYFVLSSDGSLRQYCYSKKPVEYAHGLCSAYRSPARRASALVVEALCGGHRRLLDADLELLCRAAGPRGGISL